MDLNLVEDDDVEQKSEGVLDGLKKEFKIEAPLNFIQAYSDLYRNEKARLFSSDCEQFKNSSETFFDSFKQFILLDWQNILLDLIENHKTCIFDFMLALKKKEILPDTEKLKESYAFQKYCSFVSDAKSFDVMRKAEDENFMNRISIISKDTDGKWEEIADAEKQYYVISLECASYARSSGSSQKINTLDVHGGVVVTKGLEYMSSVAFDKIIFWEI